MIASSLSIVESTFLIDELYLGPHGGHRMFDSVTRIEPGQDARDPGIRRAFSSPVPD